jgi:hypothetical protein
MFDSPYNNEDDDGDEWKKPTPNDNPRNEMDFQNSVVVNTYSNIPFDQQQWKITESESMRVDTKHKDTYFSLVLGERPYLEVYKCGAYGELLMPPERIFDLGSYFNK